MRWHSRLSSLQNAASGIALGALDIQRATGLRNMPDLTEKNAINTFLLFSPSLSPDLFMFLELCLHCLAFIGSDVGCCSTRINISQSILMLERANASAAFRVISVGAQTSIFSVWNVFFVAGLSRETLKKQRRELQIPDWTRARGGSSFGTL